MVVTHDIAEAHALGGHIARLNNGALEMIKGPSYKQSS